MVARYKWDAWEKYKGMDAHTAMELFLPIARPAIEKKCHIIDEDEKKMTAAYNECVLLKK